MAKIKIPQKITEGAFTYAIKLKPNVMADRHAAGFIDPIAEELQVDPHLPPNERMVTLCHEVGHFIERVYSLNISDDDTDRLAQGFACFLQQCDIEFDWSSIKGLSQ